MSGTSLKVGDVFCTQTSSKPRVKLKSGYFYLDSSLKQYAEAELSNLQGITVLGNITEYAADLGKKLRRNER